MNMIMLTQLILVVEVVMVVLVMRVFYLPAMVRVVGMAVPTCDG